MQSLTPEEIRTLASLRDAFLNGSAGKSDYWTTASLHLYERFPGERIGWKWDAFLSELALRQIQPRSEHLVDFGCGPGVAALRMLAANPHRFTRLSLVDRSPTALLFARNRILERFPTLQIDTGQHLPNLSGKTFIASHVFSELPPENHESLLRELRSAEEVLWVESATRPNSRAFHSAIRDALRETLTPVAPCTHSNTCPLTRSERPSDWCHFFAPVPTEVHVDPAWRHFSRELRVDLRSIPFTAIAMQRPPHPALEEPHPAPLIRARRIASAVEHKGLSKAQFCTPNGIMDLEAWKRDVPDLLKSWKKDLQLPLYLIETDGRRILTAKNDPPSDTRKA